MAVWLLRVCHAFKARNLTLLLFEIISFVEVSAHTHTLPSPFSEKNQDSNNNKMLRPLAHTIHKNNNIYHKSNY